MEMSSKEIVLRAIERRTPPRVPLSYCNRDFDSSDVIGLGVQQDPAFIPSSPGQSEWGYVWHSHDQTMGQPIAHPLADWTRIESYVPPDPWARGRFDHWPDFLATHGHRFIKAGLGISGFNQATFLRGFEAFLEDLYVEPARAERVLDLVFDFENALIEQYCAQPIDCVGFADDWGMQQNLMISPALWREIFRPRYAAQFARIHQAGKKVWFHTCGDVRAILGDLIEIGVDVLELLQPDLFGIERLAADYGGRVCFCSSVDHQRRAVSGTREEIYAYVQRLNASLGCFHGGFIGYIEDYASLGMSEQNYQWIREAFHGLSVPGSA
jgi:uroporphyrinogen decarboxylase